MPAIVLEHATIGDGRLFLIAGPCVLESAEIAFTAAEALRGLAATLRLPVIFKSSYDKANRTSHRSFRGPGLEAGLEILGEVRRRFHLPVLSDVHSVSEVDRAAEVLDLLQIPAFLCRQTDLIMAAAATGKPVNVKKGQFLSPTEMVHVAAKIRAAGNDRVILTERGTFFGYLERVRSGGFRRHPQRPVSGGRRRAIGRGPPLRGHAGAGRGGCRGGRGVSGGPRGTGSRPLRRTERHRPPRPRTPGADAPQGICGCLAATRRGHRLEAGPLIRRGRERWFGWVRPGDLLAKSA